MEPHVGVGVIKLGARREVVRADLGRLGFAHEATGALDYYCDNALQVEFDERTVTFIGVSRHRGLRCTYGGADVFDLPARTLFREIAKKEMRVPRAFDGTEYCFTSQVITLYEADEQYHARRAHAVYGQVGLGDARYLRFCRQMAQGAHGNW